MRTAVAGPKVTKTVLRICGAAAKFALPGWSAARTIVPPPVTVRVLPLTVPGPDTTLNNTGSPDVAVAVSVIGATPKATGEEGCGKVMVCGSLATWKVAVAVAGGIDPAGSLTGHQDHRPCANECNGTTGNCRWAADHAVSEGAGRVGCRRHCEWRVAKGVVRHSKDDGRRDTDAYGV